MPRKLKTDGLIRLQKKFRDLSSADFTPLMEQWRAILEEDNTEGIMRGLDGYGHAMHPVTYRPKPPTGHENLNILKNNNLHPSHYRILSGPPLAPRGLQSRVIQNFRTAWGRDGKQWVALGAWEDVLSLKDVPFLAFHFRGEGRLPQRNLAHVRPSAMTRARKALRDFVSRLLSRP
jgi:hypothetical protein